MASPVRAAEYYTRHLRLALAAREPRHIAFGMSLDAVHHALAGPPATRAQALLEEARVWAAQVDDPLVEPYFAMVEASVAMLCGRWRHSLARFDAAEQMFRNDCVGAAWEIGTVSHMAMLALMHLGRYAELRPRLARALDEADRRGDLHTATELRTALHPIVCLMDDQVATARDVLARAGAHLSRREVTILHWQHLQSSAWTELYTGAAAKAVEVLDRGLPAIRRAFLFRVYLMKVTATLVRTAAWLGALSDGAPAPRRLRAAIERACNGLGRDPQSRAVAVLVGAELAVLRGDLEAAATGYRSAARGFDAADIATFADAARWRLGELLGGDDGRALVDQARAALVAEGIVRPDRVVAMFVPVAADSRCT